MALWNELSQPELDALSVALLKALGGRKPMVHRSSEHDWATLCALPEAQGHEPHTIRDLVHTLHRFGFLDGVEDQRDRVICSGLSESGLARVRLCMGKSARSYDVRSILLQSALILVVYYIISGF